jgi:hypothetical protein
MHRIDPSYFAYIARLTDENQHWAAALSIAARFGRPEEDDALVTLANRQAARGFSQPSEIACRSTILGAILDRMPADDANQLREAL